MQPDKVAPTKSNLIAYTSNLALAEEADELLSQKREVLIMELMRIVYGLRDLQDRLNEELAKVYTESEDAYLQLGEETIERLWTVQQEEYEIEVIESSVMGIALPTIRDLRPPVLPNLSLLETSTSSDRCVWALKETLAVLLEYVETYISVWRLANEIQKIQRRTNALENIFIPQHKATIKMIEDVLEESDREEFYKALHEDETGCGRPLRADSYSADIVATLARLLSRDTGEAAPSSTAAVKASTSHW